MKTAFVYEVPWFANNWHSLVRNGLQSDITKFGLPWCRNWPFRTRTCL